MPKRIKNFTMTIRSHTNRQYLIAALTAIGRPDAAALLPTIDEDILLDKWFHSTLDNEIDSTLMASKVLLYSFSWGKHQSFWGACYDQLRIGVLHQKLEELLSKTKGAIPHTYEVGIDWSNPVKPSTIEVKVVS